MPIIDVHAHWLPRSYLDAMQAAGIRDVEGSPSPTGMPTSTWR